MPRTVEKSDDEVGDEVRRAIVAQVNAEMLGASLSERMAEAMRRLRGRANPQIVADELRR